MAINQQNIGKDVTLSIVGPTGALQPLGLLEEFEARVDSTTVLSLPINNGGYPVRRATYQGWTGHFMYDRQNGNLDRLHNLLEANFYAGNPDIHFQIQETIRNPDGTSDTFSYLDCVIKLETSGRKVQKEAIKQRAMFEASQRV